MRSSHTPSPKQRRGFTLVELLIVIGILVLILSMTVYGVNFLRDADRVSGAASQVQSFLAGARDRAIYEKDLRGVRFFVDPQNTRTVTSMAYIKPGDDWTVGLVELRRPDFLDSAGALTPDANGDGLPDGDGKADSADVTVVAGLNLGWWELKRRGLITTGSRIEIPKDSNNWYEIDTQLIRVAPDPDDASTIASARPKWSFSPPLPELVFLNIPYAEPGAGDADAVVVHSAVPYRIELPSQLLPQQPSLLPEGVVIDLDGCNIPLSWRPDTIDSEGQFSPYMDVFFSPRGNIVGSASSAGILQFYVCDAEDSQFLKELYLASINVSLGPNTASPLDTFEAQVRSTGKFIPADEVYDAWLAGTSYSATEPYLPKDRRIVSVFAQTGAITVNEVDATDSDGNGFADAPFTYSESGLGVK